MKIYLKKNWSEQFAYEGKNPEFFIGREDEIKNLKSVITNNSSSSILVSSVRGVGKTSFVHKALDEIKKNITPFFVNIGHVLSAHDIKKSKKRILTSIICRAHLEDEKDKELKKLYDSCIGKTTESKKNTKRKNNKKEKISYKSIGFLLTSPAGGFLIAIAVVYPCQYQLINILIAILGIVFLGFNFNYQWLQKYLQRSTSEEDETRASETIIYGSADYIETKFERWLKSKSEKTKKKLVFVIDELDKIETGKAFGYIKEYKNLFTRSHGHFIFIADQTAFDLTQKDRKGTIEDGGIFPTFFTHVIYLSLPRVEELKRYLSEIFKTKNRNKESENKKKDLMNYLLFRSKSDFFELKNLIADLSLFENKEAYIDSEEIKKGDGYFDAVAEMFEYIETHFLPREIKNLKKNWKDNSELQYEIFGFLNEKFTPPINFSVVDIEKKAYLKKLCEFLTDIGTLSKNSENTEYIWTGRYIRDAKAPLNQDDNSFIRSFEGLIKIGHDLRELCFLEDDRSRRGNELLEGKDGSNISKINLYSTYSGYKELYNQVKDDSQRVMVRREEVIEAAKIINQQIENVFSIYFDIFGNAMDKLLEKEAIKFDIRGSIQNYPLESHYQDFQTNFSGISHILYRNNESKKTLLIIKEFSNFDSISEGLKTLYKEKDMLIINIKRGEENKRERQKIKTEIENLKGKILKRKKAVSVENFYNVSFTEFSYFSRILSIAIPYFKGSV